MLHDEDRPWRAWSKRLEERVQRRRSSCRGAHADSSEPAPGLPLGSALAARRDRLRASARGFARRRARHHRDLRETSDHAAEARAEAGIIEIRARRLANEIHRARLERLKAHRRARALGL